MDVVQAILDQRSYPSYFHGVIDDCKAMMKNLENIRIGFVFRSVDMVHYALARSTLSMVDCMECDSIVPNFLRDVIDSYLNQ